MNREDARSLATRLSQGWPKGLTASAWEDAITDLDAGQAGTAFVRLQQTINDPTGPTVAAFLAYYRTLDTRRPEHVASCDTCDSTGWKPVIEPHPDGTERHTGVTPCHCPHGRRREEVHQRILDHNADELARLGLGHDNDPRPPATPARRPAA
jgi:hypothetical protein